MAYKKYSQEKAEVKKAFNEILDVLGYKKEDKVLEKKEEKKEEEIDLKNVTDEDVKIKIKRKKFKENGAFIIFALIYVVLFGTIGAVGLFTNGKVFLGLLCLIGIPLLFCFIAVYFGLVYTKTKIKDHLGFVKKKIDFVLDKIRKKLDDEVFFAQVCIGFTVICLIVLFIVVMICIN